MVAIGWLVATTMFFLTVSIRAIFKFITVDQAKKWQSIIQIVAISLVLLNVAAVIMIPFVIMDKKKRSEAISVTFIVTYLVLAIVYCVIILYLYKTLKEMSQYGNFNSEQKTVFMQFSFFFLAYSLKVIF